MKKSNLSSDKENVDVKISILRLGDQGFEEFTTLKPAEGVGKERYKHYLLQKKDEDDEYTPYVLKRGDFVRFEGETTIDGKLYTNNPFTVKVR